MPINKKSLTVLEYCTFIRSLLVLETERSRIIGTVQYYVLVAFPYQYCTTTSTVVIEL
jgi:hypothetical protein